MKNKFPNIDRESWFYINCKRQRKKGAKICKVCPFRKGIEEQEHNWSLEHLKRKFGIKEKDNACKT